MCGQEISLPERELVATWEVARGGASKFIREGPHVSQLSYQKYTVLQGQQIRIKKYKQYRYVLSFFLLNEMLYISFALLNTSMLVSKNISNL